MDSKVTGNVLQIIKGFVAKTFWKRMHLKNSFYWTVLIGIFKIKIYNHGVTEKGKIIVYRGGFGYHNWIAIVGFIVSCGGSVPPEGYEAFVFFGI